MHGAPIRATSVPGRAGNQSRRAQRATLARSMERQAPTSFPGAWSAEGPARICGGRMHRARHSATPDALSVDVPRGGRAEALLLHPVRLHPR